jgi:hypothetical protein
MKQKEDGKVSQREFVRGLPVRPAIGNPEKEESHE